MTKEAAIAAADGSTASANVLEAAAANEVVAKGNAKGTDPETTQAAVEYANKVANVTKQALQNGPPNIQKLGKKVLAGIKANVRVATDPSDTNIKGAVVANAAT